MKNKMFLMYLLSAFLLTSTYAKDDKKKTEDKKEKEDKKEESSEKPQRRHPYDFFSKRKPNEYY